MEETSFVAHGHYWRLYPRGHIILQFLTITLRRELYFLMPSQCQRFNLQNDGKQANLSRATIPQKRRPRRAARPFKASAAAAPPTAGSSATPAPRSDEVDKAVVTDAEPSIASEVEQSAESPSRLEVKAVADGGGATESASEGMSQASPGPAKEETTDDAENKMTSMLRAASLDAAEDKENDDEWE